MNTLTRIAASAALGALVLSSIALSPAKAETVLNFAGGGKDAGQLDPHMSTKSPDKVLFGMMFNGLVRFRPGSMSPETIEPDLAESWESSPDGLVWTFHLRKGVQFHRGYGELTADDVVYSLTRAGNPKISAVSSDYASFASVEAVDKYTVRITLKNAVPSLLSLVANYHGGNVISKKAGQEMGDNFKLKPVGTGPFALIEYKSRQYVKLAAHTGYFRGAPKIDVLNYLYVPSDSSRELAFKKGELDVFLGKREERWIDRMKKLKTLTVDVFEPGELRTLHMNTTSKPLDDIRVRKAIAHALDREELRAFVGNSVTRATWSPVPNGYLGQASDLPRYEHDPAKARALLKEAGYGGGVTVKAIITKRNSLLSPMQIIQEQLRRVGITLELEVVEHTAFHAQIRKDASPMVLYGAARFPIADTYLTQFYHSRSIVGTPTAVTNFSHCDVADAEIDAARVETDPAKQKALWAAAQRKLMEKVCSVPLFEQLQVWARRNNVDYGFDLEGTLSLGALFNETSTIK
jgi:peptide/nickel transport system substrate-binding protein